MKILWLKTELLHPVDKGGKIRSYNMLKELKRNCHVTYLTLDDGTADHNARELASEYCHELVSIPHQHREKFTPGFYVELIVQSRFIAALRDQEIRIARDAARGCETRSRLHALMCWFVIFWRRP